MMLDPSCECVLQHALLPRILLSLKQERKKGFWKVWRKYDCTSDSLDRLNHIIVVIS
jgi:hypothetical protein